MTKPLWKLTNYANGSNVYYSGSKKNVVKEVKANLEKALGIKIKFYNVSNMFLNPEYKQCPIAILFVYAAPNFIDI